ncbi:MAG: gliding motility-associated ABC transporter substrate-binding protein GldG [Bacteroidetes bacterium]|nr:gliding motility-associated ABC transporter substrate-binding protein GldG [Bacteroidota bacterium]
MSQNNKIRKKNLIQFLIALIIISALNMIGGKSFFRLDMTAEKRYSLTNSTKEMLRDLDDIVYFKVYLEGSFPAEFKRLSNQTREMLEEFRAYSSMIQFEFINPLKASDARQRQANIDMLTRKGLIATQLQIKAEDASSQQVIFPAALVSYKGREIPVHLLMDQIGVRHEEILNNSSQALEYNLASAIRQLITFEKPNIGFLEGLGGPAHRNVVDIKISLGDFYNVKNIVLDTSYLPLQNLSTLIIVKPRKEFPETTKFLIDQFIMQGGSCFWLIDPVFAEMDSLRAEPETIGMGWPVNIDDMLFRYGVRLNVDLLKDLRSVPIPITTGMVGNRPQISLVPWYYFPMITPTSNHPIVRNLNAIKTQFISSIDTIGVEGIKKTFLLQTSPYTRVMQTPTRISLDILHNPPDESLFRAGQKPVAVLLEGSFESIYKNRIPPNVHFPEGFEIRDKSANTSMVVVADGDIILNSLDQRGQPLPLGYDRFLNETFGNKDFVLNSVNYLSNDPSIMEARNKEIRLRMLDKTAVNNSKAKIQFYNVVLPVLLITIFGIVRFWLRKRKYTR